MCGISAWYDKNTDFTEKTEEIRKISDSLRRRGPDDGGVLIKPPVCLIHRRLAVIDPENGRQPMSRIIDNRAIHIVYNGEIYNTDELREELSARGYSFLNKSDTEVVLLSYAEWGEECVEHLNGIFAFAVYDEESRRLFFARDRIGVKPLFFCHRGESLILCSQLGGLLASGQLKAEIDERGLYELFLLGPGRTGGQGVYKDAEELLPGECAVFDGQRLFRRRYFRLRAEPYQLSTEQSIIKVRELLFDAVQRQLVSDVPLCCFLSGGLDSSIISYIASEYKRKNSNGKIDTYSVDYRDNDKYFKKSLFQPTPDSDFIDIISQHIDSVHHSVTIDNYDLFSALTNAVDARDLPGMTDVDSSLLLFCSRIKEDFTVALSGECADELFGGYPWYHNRDILFEDNFPWSRSLDIRRSILKKGFLPRGDEYVREKYLETCNSADKLPTDSKTDIRMREMFCLNFYWFMQTLLDRKDRMSMYSGLEVRVPFCDYRIAELAYNMPWHIKSLGGREKGIVRAAFKGLLPDSIIERKKSPYPKTHSPVYFELCAARCREILRERTSVMYELLDVSGVESVIENPDMISSPWYGQLMRAPQILAYIIQLDHWFKLNNVKIV